MYYLYNNKQTLILTTMKTINSIIERHYNKIGFSEIYPEAKTVVNGWFGEVQNCIAYIELLGLSNTTAIMSELKESGLKMKIYGLDIYIIK
jgi:hypothetical protein